MKKYIMLLLIIAVGCSPQKKGEKSGSAMQAIDDATITTLMGSITADMPGADTRLLENCLLYTSPSPRDRTRSRMPSSA